MKIVLKILGSLLFLATLLASLIGYLLFTEPGLHTAITLLPLLSRHRLSISEGYGVLTQQVDLKNITYTDAKIHLAMDDMNIHWHWKNMFHVSAQIALSHFTLNGITVPASQWQGTFDYSHDKFHIETLHGTLSDKANRADINLSFKDMLDTAWNIDIRDLKNFAPDLSGKLVTKGHFQNNTLTTGILLTGLQYKTTAIQQFSITLQGLLQDNQLNLILSPQHFIFSSTTLGHWFLTQPAHILLSPTKASVDALKFRQANNRLVFSGQWQKNKTWSLHETGKITLQDYHISPVFDLNETGDTKKITYTGEILSGPGNISLQGFTQHAATQLTLSGNQFLAANTEQYKIWATPNLQLHYKNNLWYLTGDLFIPKATINLPSSENAVVTLPSDVVFADQKTQTSSLPLESTIQVKLGNDIQVVIQGFKGNIRGNVKIHDAPNQLTTADGRLTILNGSYKLYGQTLAIQYGNLIFNNTPITNPDLNIRAVKKMTVSNASGSTMVSSGASTLDEIAGTITVGATVTGNLTTPQVNLFSDPANLAQMDILSYLVLGHPAANASPMDAQLLLQATQSMDSSSGKVEQLRREIQHTFGIDSLNIESINYVNPSATTPGLSQTTALVLKKSLSPRLYLSYSASLTGAVNIFTIKYTLSQHWIVQSTTSTFGSGADIFAVWH